MSEVRQEQPSMLAKADDIQRQIHDLSSRDMQLWSIVSLVILVLTMDLKDFREINSKLGSMEGNRVLTEFSRMLKKVFRGGDLIFRQGGDEFLVVMPDTSEQQADSPLRRLLDSVDQWNAENGKH